MSEMILLFTDSNSSISEIKPDQLRMVVHNCERKSGDPMKSFFWLIMLVITLLFSLSTPPTVTHATGVIFAKPVATGAGNCLSWGDACTLQTALSGATSDSEIWVAAGTHKPTTVETDRQSTFQLKGGVSLFGGFAGAETARDQRNPAVNITILSGDIDHNDSQTPIITDPATVTGNTTNSLHVVTGSAGATLDGFTITAGNANGVDACPGTGCGGGMVNISGSNPILTNLIFRGNSSSINFGGGMYNHGSSPTLTNVTFANNRAYNGAGMANISSSYPILTNVAFDTNSANWGGGMYNWASSPILNNVTFKDNWAQYGGGMENDQGSSPILTDVTFSGNDGFHSGGGMYNNNYSNPALTNVTFSDNTVLINDGGGIYNWYSSPTLTNVTFRDNLTSYSGGGMYNGHSSPTLTNVTFSNNSGGNRGAGMGNEFSSNPVIRNTIFWNNETQVVMIYHADSTSVLSDCIVQGGCPPGSSCTRVIDANPMLGALGNNGGLTQTVPLLTGSPAIDTANDSLCPAQDQRGVIRPQGTHCDMGAYEYIDTIAPTVITIVRIDPSPTNATSVNFTVTFSEPVTDVSIGDFILNAPGITGAVVSGVAGSGKVYTVTVNTGTGTGTLRLDIPVSATISDFSLNPLAALPFMSGENYFIDRTAPVAISILPASPSPTHLNDLIFTVTFSEVVTDVNEIDFSVTTTGDVTGWVGENGILSGWGTNIYTVSVQSNGNAGTLRLDVSPGATIVDLAANPMTTLPYTAGTSYFIDKLPPVVVSVLRADPNPTKAASVNFTVTFSEPVTGVNATDFILATTHITDAAVSSVIGSGTVYTVSINTGSGSGTLRLDVEDNETIVDEALNPIFGNGYQGNFTGGESYKVRFFQNYLPVVLQK